MTDSQEQNQPTFSDPISGGVVPNLAELDTETTSEPPDFIPPGQTPEEPVDGNPDNTLPDAPDMTFTTPPSDTHVPGTVYYEEPGGDITDGYIEAHP